MADKHVRARCLTTGAVAALPERALDLGMFPAWRKLAGPAPKRPKPAAFPTPHGRPAVEPADAAPSAESPEE